MYVLYIYFFSIEVPMFVNKVLLIYSLPVYKVAVFGGGKEKVCRHLKTIDEISRQKIDIRVGMVPVL